MIPSAVVFIDKVPTTPTGKVDEKALPTPEFVDDRVSRAEHAYGNRCCDCLLGGPRWTCFDVGADDNFFELGGNSPSAMRVATRARSPRPRDPAAVVDDRADSGVDSESRGPGQESAGALDARVRFGRPVIGRLCSSFTRSSVWPWSCRIDALHRFGNSGCTESRPAVLLSADPSTSIELPRLPGTSRKFGESSLEGPHHLAGWSLGGVIAHAMAVQRRRRASRSIRW